MSVPAAATSIGKQIKSKDSKSSGALTKNPKTPSPILAEDPGIPVKNPATKEKRCTKPPEKEAEAKCKKPIDKTQVEEAIENKTPASAAEDGRSSNTKEFRASDLDSTEADDFRTKDDEAKACVENATTQTEATIKYRMIPIAKQTDTCAPSKVAVPRRSPPLSMPLLNERPLVVATHLVPSLPVGLFEVLVEAIEVATEKPVVLLYEPRSERPVAKEVADIAILPASEDWEAGVLLPVSFCFEHRLNKDNSPCIFADIVVATDSASHVEDITDLRGHRCSLPDRRKQIGAATLLFNHLHTRGESPAFFGNTLDASTQVATLQMVAGKQAEVGILEAPVIKCHKDALPGVESLHILTSLGPLPPYRIMANKGLSEVLMKKVTEYLLNIDRDKEWVERFKSFGVTRFTKNSTDLYELGDVKSAVTSVPYY